MNKEMRCIELAAEAKRDIALRQLVALKKSPPKYESPLSGFSWKEVWQGLRTCDMKQLLYLPAALFTVGILVLFIPVTYGIHIYEAWKRKHSLKKKIKYYRGIENPLLPERKDLQSLWGLHGFGKYEGTREDAAALLGRWVSILYGDEVMSVADIEAELEQITSRRIQGKIAFMEGKSDTHCHFGPPVDLLIGRLSDQLPAYE